MPRVDNWRQHQGYQGPGVEPGMRSGKCAQVGSRQQHQEACADVAAYCAKGATLPVKVFFFTAIVGVLFTPGVDAAGGGGFGTSSSSLTPSDGGSNSPTPSSSELPSWSSTKRRSQSAEFSPSGSKQTATASWRDLTVSQIREMTASANQSRTGSTGVTSTKKKGPHTTTPSEITTRTPSKKSLKGKLTITPSKQTILLTTANPTTTTPPTGAPATTTQGPTSQASGSTGAPTPQQITTDVPATTQRPTSQAPGSTVAATTPNPGAPNITTEGPVPQSTMSTQDPVITTNQPKPPNSTVAPPTPSPVATTEAPQPCPSTTSEVAVTSVSLLSGGVLWALCSRAFGILTAAHRRQTQAAMREQGAKTQAGVNALTGQLAGCTSFVELDLAAKLTERYGKFISNVVVEGDELKLATDATAGGTVIEMQNMAAQTSLSVPLVPKTGGVVFKGNETEATLRVQDIKKFPLGGVIAIADNEGGHEFAQVVAIDDPKAIRRVFSSATVKLKKLELNLQTANNDILAEDHNALTPDEIAKIVAVKPWALYALFKDCTNFAKETVAHNSDLRPAKPELRDSALSAPTIIYWTKNSGVIKSRLPRFDLSKEDSIARVLPAALSDENRLENACLLQVGSDGILRVYPLIDNLDPKTNERLLNKIKNGAYVEPALLEKYFNWQPHEFLPSLQHITGDQYQLNYTDPESVEPSLYSKMITLDPGRAKALEAELSIGDRSAQAVAESEFAEVPVTKISGEDLNKFVSNFAEPSHAAETNTHHPENGDAMTSSLSFDSAQQSRKTVGSAWDGWDMRQTVSTATQTEHDSDIL